GWWRWRRTGQLGRDARRPSEDLHRRRRDEPPGSAAEGQSSSVPGAESVARGQEGEADRQGPIREGRRRRTSGSGEVVDAQAGRTPQGNGPEGEVADAPQPRLGIRVS